MVAPEAPRILLDSDWVIKRGYLSSLGRRRVPKHSTRLRRVVAAPWPIKDPAAVLYHCIGGTACPVARDNDQW